MEPNRREFLVVGGRLAGLALIRPAWPIGSSRGDSPWPGYRDATVIDACGSPLGNNPGSDPLDAATLAAIRDSGVTAVNFTVGSVGRYANAYEETVAAIRQWDAAIAAHPDVLMKIARGAGIDDAKRSGRLGVLYGFQDTTMYGETLERFDQFYDAGVRIVQLTYNRRNLMGDGCLEPGNAGLSRLGREMVTRMNDRGMLVDLSHCGQRTTHEGILASRKPVAITHTGCAALAEMPRNKRDEELKLLADRGGVVGIYVMPYLRTSGQVMAGDVIRHVEYALKLCGEDHVGVGTDGGIPGVDVTDEFRKAFAAEIAERQRLGISAPGERPDSFTFALDLNTPRRLEQIATLLTARGHHDRVIEKVVGANFARLFREVIV